MSEFLAQELPLGIRFLGLLGDIADERFCLLRLMLPFHGLSVHLSVTFIHCA